MKTVFLVFALCFLSGCFATTKQKWELQNKLELQASIKSEKMLQHRKTFKAFDISVNDDLDRIYREIEETKNGS